MGGQAFGPKPHAFRAQEAHGPQVGFLKPVLPHHQTLRFVDFRLGPGHGHLQNVRAVEEPLCVGLEAKNGRPLGGGIRAYALKAPQAIVQGMSEYVHLSVAPGDQLTVKPNHPIAVGEIRHCHVFTPSRALGPKVTPTLSGESRPDLRNLLRQRHYRGIVGAGIGALQGTAMIFGAQGQVAIPKKRG